MYERCWWLWGHIRCGVSLPVEFVSNVHLQLQNQVLRILRSTICVLFGCTIRNEICQERVYLASKISKHILWNPRPRVLRVLKSVRNILLVPHSSGHGSFRSYKLDPDSKWAFVSSGSDFPQTKHAGYRKDSHVFFAKHKFCLDSRGYAACWDLTVNAIDSLPWLQAEQKKTSQSNAWERMSKLDHVDNGTGVVLKEKNTRFSGSGFSDRHCQENERDQMRLYHKAHERRSVKLSHEL